MESREKSNNYLADLKNTHTQKKPEINVSLQMEEVIRKQS